MQKWCLRYAVDVTTPCSYNLPVRFEWDESKREANILKHGIDFVGVEEVFEGETITILDESVDYREERFLTFGLLNGHVLVIAHTETDEVIRIISVRKATRNEEISYFNEIAD